MSKEIGFSRRGLLKGMAIAGGAATAAVVVGRPEAASATTPPDSYDVTAYGATGDGTTDDTAAIQSAINAAHTAGGGRVYFPVGTYIVTPATHSGTSYVYALLTYGNIELAGAVRDASIIKVKSGAGSYWTVIICLTDASGLQLRNVTINNNNTGNPATKAYYARSYAMTGSNVNYDSNGYPVGLASPDFRSALWFGQGNRVVIENTRFTDIGDGIWTIGANGELDSQTTGPGTTPRVSDTVIQNNIFEGIGSLDRNLSTYPAVPGYVGPHPNSPALQGKYLDPAVHDYSGIYWVGDGVIIANNFFTATAQGKPGAYAAIETHGSRQRVTGNHILNLANGMNITGYQGIPTYDVQVDHNTIKGGTYGLQVEALQYQNLEQEGPPPVYGNNNANEQTLPQLSIHHNQISLDRDAWPIESRLGLIQYAIGIWILQGIDAVPANPSTGEPATPAVTEMAFASAQIHHNQIQFSATTAAAQFIEFYTAGITLERSLALLESPATGPDRGVSLSDNYIAGAPATGIYAYGPVDGLDVCRNMIVNPGSLTATVSAPSQSALQHEAIGGILIGSDGTMKNVRINDNAIIDTRTTSNLAFTIQAASSKDASTTPFVNCEALDNVLSFEGSVSTLPVFTTTTPTPNANQCFFIRARVTNSINAGLLPNGYSQYGSMVTFQGDGGGTAPTAGVYMQQTAKAGFNWLAIYAA